MDKNTENNMLGCFVSASAGKWDDDQNAKDLAADQSKLFRAYIWGESGICETLKKLINKNYGHDLLLILFQFYVNPLPTQIANFSKVDGYRKKEKSIGIPIVVSGDNFFNKTEVERRNFLRNSIYEGLSLVEDIVKKKKLDTDMEKLKKDMESIF